MKESGWELIRSRTYFAGARRWWHLIVGDSKADGSWLLRVRLFVR